MKIAALQFATKIPHQIPLMILAVGSIVTGFIPFNELVTSDGKPFESELELMVAIPSVLVALFGIGFAYLLYFKTNGLPDKVAGFFKYGYKWAYNKFYIDEIYIALFEKPFGYLSDFLFNKAENKVLDPAVNGIGLATLRLGTLVRKLQQGNISFYLFAMVAGILLFIIFILIV